MSRKFRLQMTVDDSDVQTIFDLLHDIAHDFKMIELADEPARTNGGVPTSTPTAYEAYKNKTSGRWASLLWPMIEPIFKAEKTRSKDGLVQYNDPRLKDVLIKTGNSPSTITPLLSELRRQGKVVRPHRGWYMLP